MLKSRPSIDLELEGLSLVEDVKIVSKLDVQQIQAVKDKIRSFDKFPLESTKTRNIIMLGRSGSGKSTAIDILKDICAQPRPQSLFSETVDPRFQSFSLDDVEAKMKYTLNIIDTPGVQEVKPIGEYARSDNAILDTIKYCLKNEITRIHTLFIFASFEQRITILDKEAFKLYLDMFYNDQINIAFCITRSEGQDEEWKSKIVSDLTIDDYFKDLLQKPNVNIFFTGCVSNPRVATASDMRTLFGYYNEIYNMRRDIVKFVFSSNDDGVMLLHLPIVSISKAKMLEIFEIQDDILNQFENADDLNTGSMNLSLSTFCDNVNYMVQNEGLLYDPELFQRFQTMKQKMRVVSPRMGVDMRIRLTSTIVL